MPFSISDFSSKINRYGLAKSNLFLVSLTVPSALGDIANDFNSRDIQFFCRSVEIPDLTIDTMEHHTQGVGFSHKRPVGMTMQNVGTVFMVDSGYRVKEFFHRWMQAVYNYNTDNPLGEADGKLPHEIGYKSEYVSQMTVTQYSDNSPDQYYSYHYRNVYPVTVGATSLSWDTNDTVLVLPVAFCYEGFTPLGSRANAGTSDRMSRGTGMIEAALNLNTLYQTIKQFDRPDDIQDLVNQYTTISNQLDRIF